jgi:hypothetical protein
MSTLVTIMWFAGRHLSNENSAYSLQQRLLTHTLDADLAISLFAEAMKFGR